MTSSRRWRKPTRSNTGGNCVEVALPEPAECPDTVGVRDSKNPGGGEIEVSPDAWDALVEGIKAGEFD